MGEKILVIDDEPLILLTIDRALSKLGYLVETTSDMKVFKRALSAGTVDLIIMDLHMRGINTNQLLEEIRQSRCCPGVLVISGSVPGPFGRNFLQKPFRLDDLRQMVRNILDEKPRG